MLRSTLVAIISIIYLVVGLSNISNALFSVLFSSGIIILELFSLVGGALAIYAGSTMLRFGEFGRKLVIVLLSIRVIINSLILLRVLPYLEAGVWLGVVNRLGEVVYRIENPYAYPGFFLIWIVLALLTILFLSQSETKKIFVPETIKDVKPDIILED